MYLNLDLSFKRIYSKMKWDSLEDFLDKGSIILNNEIRHLVEHKRRLRDRISKLKGVKERITSPTEDEYRRALNLLKEGRVCGIDGTLSVYPTLIGAKCRIGVVVVNYKWDRVERVIYISDTMLIDSELKDPVKLLERVERVGRVSTLLYKFIMLYKERELATLRDEDWRLVHGPLVPLEMRLGRLGVKGALTSSLELAKRLIETESVVGVLSSTVHLRLLSLGYLLNSGEYMYVMDAGDLWRAQKRGIGVEEPLVDDFIEKYGDKVGIGIYRIGARVYTFQAPKRRFREAASIVIIDSLNNRVQGFPLLLSYADSVCRTLLSSEVFKEQIENTLLLEEGEEGFMHLDERRLRL